MKTILINLYSFEELDEKAKQKALQAYHDLNTDYYWWDFIYDDFVTVCEYLGINVDKNAIHFEGFYSQGDGSSFVAEVDFVQLLNSIANEGWREYAPKQEFGFTLPGIDKRVLTLVNNTKIELAARIISRQRGYGVVVDLGLDDLGKPAKNHDLIYGELDKLEKWLNNVADILNAFLYRSLQNEYEYQTTDAAIAESIEANEYCFTVDGEKAGRLEKIAVNN